MEENFQGYLGQQTVEEGGYIVPKTPQDFEFENNGNLLFDDVKKWTLDDGTTLLEGSQYTYGRDISVQANWLKRVIVHIWCFDMPSQAGSDLIQNVQIVGGTPSVTEGYDKYAFFRPENEIATFIVTGCNSDNVITVNNRTYKFIGWSKRVPFSSIDQGDTNFIESQLKTYSVYPIDFSSSYLKEEWAVFMVGTTASFTVKTNVAALNNNPNSMFKYWIGDEATFSSAMFGSTINADNYIGDVFKCEVSTTTAYNGYTFVGWYFGDYNSPTPPSSFISQTQTTQWLYIITSQITLTAIYIPSGTGYTISYYSGLPES